MSDLYRRTGLEFVGDVPWGTHFCHVYQREQDLLLLELPFLKVGLKDQEFCWWILPEHLTPQAAQAALRQAVPDLDRYLQLRQIEFTSLSGLGASGSLQLLAEQWQARLQQALGQGFQGLRVVHSISGQFHENDSHRLGEHLETGLRDVPVLVLCLVPVRPGHILDTLQMVKHHSRVVTLQDGEWKMAADPAGVTSARLLEHSHARFQSILESTGDGIALLDESGMIVEWSRSLENMTGLARSNAAGRYLWDIFEQLRLPGVENALTFSAIRAGILRRMQVGVDESQPNQWEVQICRADAATRTLEFGVFVYPGAHNFHVGFVVRDITERKLLEQSLVALKKSQQAEREHRLISDTLKDIVLDLNGTLDSGEVLRRAVISLQRVLPFDASSIFLFEKGRLNTVQASGYMERGFALEGRVVDLDPFTNPFFSKIIQTGAVVIADTQKTEDWCADPHLTWVRSHLSLYLKSKHITGFLNLESAQVNAFCEADVQRLQAVAEQIAWALENAWLFENARRRADEMAAIVAFSFDLRKAPQRSEMLPVILDNALKLLNAQGAALVFHSGARGELMVELGRGIWKGMSDNRLPVADVYTTQAMESFQQQQITDIKLMKAFHDQPGLSRLAVAICVPLVAQNQPVGALWIGLETPLLPDDLHLLMAISEISANALHRAALNEKTVERLQQLTTLHAVETAVNSSLDMGIVMGILLDRLIGVGGVGAADVLLLSPYSRNLEISASRGFRVPPLRLLHLGLNEEFSGRAVLERRSIIISEFSGYSNQWKRYHLMQTENIQTFIAVPLFSKGRVTGVLEVFFRRSYKPDQEWMEFIEGLGNQLAIAINNSSLVAELQRSNLELVQAYDVTLEGWARTLRLRDNEPEEHNQRLLERTLALARALKIDEAEFIHIRRGVLMHDIGKLGLPDSILQNHGLLSADEMNIMRQHPQTAYELLAPVSYLHPILDIPYCHHERWDGSGYPRGLIGEQIPLAARLFAVVDVWDALTSHHRYRAAWSPAKAAQYLREQAGCLFDPYIVDVFLRQSIQVLPEQLPTLLIVDDEEGVLHTLARSLRQDYHIFTANRAQKALEVIKANPVMVILTDQRMPEMTGVEMMRQVAELSPSTTGVVISAYSDTPAVLAAMSLPNICGILSKPWTSQELRQRLNEAVRLSRKKAG